jgi:hypothetical protein
MVGSSDMPMTHSGQYAIEHYYPGGFGPTATDCKFTWLPTTQTIPNPIFEQETVGPNGCVQMSVAANYTECLSSIINHTYVPKPGTSYIDFQCCGPGEGDVKYALLGGEFPPNLYLDIDTGKMIGLIDELEVIAPKRLGVPPGFKFDETNYLKYAVPGLALKFYVRAFDSGNTASYDDREMQMYVRTNWSSRRDRFVLNIENQFYLDGKPVDNKTYVKGMKSKGYYPGPGCK